MQMPPQARTRTRTEKKEPRRDCCEPGCPECGGLDCLCRPRFFAGQLLSERDLNRLDRYIRDKHRLHNRYLHGWGVVCGMEVSCDDCGDGVRVSEGYALSPCGDDIVLCQDDIVDVGDLVRRCRERERARPDCYPPWYGQEECEDAEETWILAVCYEERPSRGTTPLRDVKSCGCGCGHHQNERCSGDSHHNGDGNGNGHRPHRAGEGARTGAASARRAAQCEPTVVCEGHRFSVYRAPTPSLTEEEDEQGRLVDRFEKRTASHLLYAEQFGKAYDPEFYNQPRAEKYRYACLARDRLRRVLREQPHYECDLVARLGEVAAPHPDAQLSDEDYDARLALALGSILGIWFESLIATSCAVLLPPCPEPPSDNCVPLAAVTLRRADGRVLRVCNWTVHRKFATTVPGLKYWLSLLPFGGALREGLEWLCCRLGYLLRQSTAAWAPEEEEREIDETEPPPIPVHGLEQPKEERTFAYESGARPYTARKTGDFTSLLFDGVIGRTTPLTPQKLLLGLSGQEGLRGIELDNLLPYLLSNTVLQPLVGQAVPADLGAALSLFSAGRAMGGAAPEESADVAGLRSELDDMRESLKRQEKTIESLKQRLHQEEEGE